MFLICLCASPAVAQRTTNFTGTFTINDTEASTFNTALVGTGSVGTLGTALLQINTFQPLADDGKSGVGQMGSNLTISFNRQDSITIANSGIPNPTLPTITVSGRVMGGTGAYAGATGPAGGVMTTVTRTSTTPLRYTLGLTGSATVSGQSVNLAISNAVVTQMVTFINVFDNLTGMGSVPPLGNATVTGMGRPNTNDWKTATAYELILNVAFSATDSVQMFMSIAGEEPPPNIPVTITGGSGAFAGASGSGLLNVTANGAGTVSGSVTVPGTTTPVITAANTASGSNPISQNDWIEIKGTNLVPANTPNGGMFWSNAPEFAQGRMPTQLGGVSVMVNGKPAHVWWFCSAATTPSCATDQINVLTPLDDAVTQQALVTVTSGGVTSGAALRRRLGATPSFLLVNPKGYGVATHADGTLVGPATLFPGASTPARRGETISLWSVGFGLPTTPLVAGSATQSGSLTSTPACTLGGMPTTVAAALVSPGLYQLNATIPDNAPAGDSHFVCGYADVVTPVILLTVQ